MRLNISDIPEYGIQREVEIPIAVNDNARPVTAHVFIKVFRFGRRVLVEGSLKISVLLNCSRCLKEYSYPVDADFRDEYVPADEFEKEGEKELTDSELDLSFYRNDEMDISELIKEQVLLSVPMKPLCSLDCHGICSKCGKDLNEGPCGCKVEEMDPRLAPLSKFKESMKDRGTS